MGLLINLTRQRPLLVLCTILIIIFSLLPSNSKELASTKEIQLENINSNLFYFNNTIKIKGMSSYNISINNTIENQIISISIICFDCNINYSVYDNVPKFKNSGEGQIYEEISQSYSENDFTLNHIGKWVISFSNYDKQIKFVYVTIKQKLNQSSLSLNIFFIILAFPFLLLIKKLKQKKR